MRITSSLFLLAITLHVFAQKLPFDNYTVQDNLPQNTVIDIDQDLQGYIWFATQVGAARFDGYDFEHFNSSVGLPDDQVNAICVDSKGGVWLGTEGGIALVEGKEIRTLGKADGLIDDRVDHLLEDSEGNIWASTAYGVSVIRGDSIRCFDQDHGLVSNKDLSMHAAADGRVYVAGNPGLSVFKGGELEAQLFEDEVFWSILETRNGDLWLGTIYNGVIVISGQDTLRLGSRQGLGDEAVLSMMEDAAGRIWCATYSSGVYVYDGKEFRIVSLNPSQEPVITRMHEDEAGRKWFLTYNDGLWLLDRGRIKHITEQSGLLSDIIWDIREDSFGNIWFATVEGASKYGRMLFEVWDEDFGMPETIYAVYRDSRNRIWFGSYGELYFMEDDHPTRIGSSQGFHEEELPLSFAEDGRGRLYIGTDMDLLYYDGNRVTSLPWWAQGPGREQLSVNALAYVKKEGLLWIATDSGVYVKKGAQLIYLGEDEGLVNQQVNALLHINGQIWCATEGGVSVFRADGSHLRNYTLSDGLAAEICLDLSSDQKNRVWVGTNRGISGIPFTGEGDILTYTTYHGLSSNMNYFVEYANGYLWIGTERGIDRLDLINLEVDYYGTMEGFYPLETNAGAVCAGEKGSLWMGTVAGLVRYDPAYDKIDTRAPSLILFPPEVKGEPLILPKADSLTGKRAVPELPYNRNSFNFKWTGIHTTIPSRNRFSYYLEGVDDDWSAVSPDRSRAYAKLNNGSYVFKLRAYNLDGQGVEQELSFPFVIKPPLWETFWFIMLEVMAGLMLIYGFIKYRERQLIREKKVLESKVQQRTREIQEQKRQIEHQRDEISEQNREITGSIHYALRIQQAVLPGKKNLEQVLPAHFIFYRPRDIVSGDFYWVERKNGKVFVCAGDCTGHGVPGAFMSLLGLTFLNEIVNKDGVEQADEILERLRNSIINTLSQQHEENEARDGMDLALAVFDLPKKQLEFAGAYNPLILVREGELIEYKADRMPIGMLLGEEGPFTRHRFDLKYGDMVYMFSDGYADQFGGEKGRKYKGKRLRDLLLRISTETVEKQERLIAGELLAWQGDQDQVDDILVMGVRYEEN